MPTDDENPAVGFDVTSLFSTSAFST